MTSVGHALLLLDFVSYADIAATKFIIGAGVGIPAASLCINRRLYKIATVQQAVSGFREVSSLP